MSLKCTGCGVVVDESHIRFCRSDMGDHLCGSLMMPYEEPDEQEPLFVDEPAEDAGEEE